MANPELGAKQICPNDQTKFYDLGRRPAVCPKCRTSFDPEEALRSRRVRARTATPDYEDEPEVDPKKRVPADEETDGFEEEVEETPEIDEAVEADPIETDDDDTEADPAAPAVPADDLGVDFAEEEDVADDDEVPFIEDEDEDFPEDEIDGLPEDGDEDR